MADEHGEFWVVNRMKRLGNGVDRSYGTKEKDDVHVLPLQYTEADLPFDETQERRSAVRYFERMPKKK